MSANSLTPIPSAGKPVTDAITNLCIAASGGARLAVRPEERQPAVEWTRLLLTNPRVRPDHYAHVDSVFRNTAIPRAPWAQFADTDPSDASAEAHARVVTMAQSGPDTFSDEELAYL